MVTLIASHMIFAVPAAGNDGPKWSEGWTSECFDWNILKKHKTLICFRSFVNFLHFSTMRFITIKSHHFLWNIGYFCPTTWSKSKVSQKVVESPWWILHCSKKDGEFWFTTKWSRSALGSTDNHQFKGFRKRFMERSKTQNIPSKMILQGLGALTTPQTWPEILEFVGCKRYLFYIYAYDCICMVVIVVVI